MNVRCISRGAGGAYRMALDLTGTPVTAIHLGSFESGTSGSFSFGGNIINAPVITANYTAGWSTGSINLQISQDIPVFSEVLFMQPGMGAPWELWVMVQDTGFAMWNMHVTNDSVAGQALN